MDVVVAVEQSPDVTSRFRKTNVRSGDRLQIIPPLRSGVAGVQILLLRQEGPSL